MNTRPYLRPVVLLLELGVLIYLLLPQSLFHSFSCELDKKYRRQNYQAADGAYVAKQVIVIGTEAAVRAVIGTPDQPGTARVTLNPIESCDLSYLNTRKIPNLELRERSTQQPKVVMQLYEIADGTDVNTVITRLGPNLTVSLNYFISVSDPTPDACIRNGDPGSGGGHPYGGPGPILPSGYDPAEAQRLFKEQWAFRGPHSINFDSWMTSTSSSRPTGDDIRIGVFDTSPFRNPIPFFNRIGIAFPSPLGYTTWDAGGATMMSNHGLFVTALIHSIAPKSSIQLIRVLNDSGCGEVWVLNKGLQDYISRMSAWSGDLDDTVINMSLGIPKTLTGDDVATLQATLRIADQLGAVIIAAAGNGSAPTPQDRTKPAQDMEIPASYDQVLGVAATRPDGKRSCYSNKGEITAPGGDGGTDPQDSTKTCEPRTSDWDQAPNACDPKHMDQCQYGLISLVQTRYGPQQMIWSGTSFAAPLVSGLAALAYEQNTHDQVICIIKNEQIKHEPRRDPIMGWGSIDLNNNLSPSEIAHCRNLYKSTGDD